MCYPIHKPIVPNSARAAHDAVLALHEVLAKYNAAIRVKFPPSAPLTRAMERSTSGWVNDAPFMIEMFKHAAEDAIYAELTHDYFLSHGVSEVLDNAQKWAGCTPIDDWGKQVWAKRISIVDVCYTHF